MVATIADINVVRTVFNAIALEMFVFYASLDLLPIHIIASLFVEMER